MPPSSSRLILNGLSVSQLEKFIPKKWKQPINNEHIMRINLIETLKDFAGRGNLSKAFEAFSRIRITAASHDVVLDSFAHIIFCCGKVKALAQGKQLHACAIALGLEKNPVLVPKLVTFYASFSLYNNACFLVENSNIRYPLPWNLLISLYVRDGFYAEALCVYKQMQSRRIRGDNFTYPSVLKACGEMMDVDFGRVVHSCIDACHEWSLFVHNALVSMYGKFGQVNVARRLFDKMLERDAVSWNTMISAYASKGLWKEAFQLFVEMQEEGVEVNVITWNTIAGGCLRTGNFKGVLELLSRMRTQETYLDSVATVIGLGACSHIGALKLGKEIHGSAVRGCYGEYENVRNALITMYSRCKDLRHAYILFKMTAEKSIITWNSMLSGYTHLDCAEESAFLFREMFRSGVEPNYVTIASILPLCARVANLQHGKEFHCYILRRAMFNEHLLLWNSLVEMYARSGKVPEAKSVFDLMSRRDEVTYTSLIAGYGIQGEGRVALKLFEEMNKNQIKPDHVTMVAVLSACSHSGLVVEGQKQFERMTSIYGIFPQLEHFACMVDLYGRAGLLNKAKEIITKMPYTPTSAMWATLLGACQIHRNTGIGEWAAEKLLETRPENSGYYVLIANLYAAAGCWDKLAKVRTCMRDLGVRKIPGCAWVDAGSVFSPFLVDDTSNVQAQEIYPLLGGLTELMKDAGYVVKEEFCSEEEIVEEIG